MGVWRAEWGGADLAMAHEKVGDLVEKGGVPVVQVCAGGDR